MKIKWKVSISGTVYNHDGGVKPGDVMEISDAEADRVIALGQAEAVKPGGKLSEEHAVAAFSDEERAVLDRKIVGASAKPIPQPRAPKSEPEDLPLLKAESGLKSEPKSSETHSPKSEPPKRGPGRPRKA